jgi:hypothetical protein
VFANARYSVSCALSLGGRPGAQARSGLTRRTHSCDASGLLTTRRAALLAVAFALTTAALLHVPTRHPVRLEIGGFEDGMLVPAWGRSERENLDPPAATDDVLTFYRRAAPANSTIALPVVARGTVRLIVRAWPSVRSEVGVFVDGQAAGKLLFERAPWAPHALEFPAAMAHGGPLDVSLAMKPLPLVRGAHVDNPQLFVDYVEVAADGGTRLSTTWIAVLSLLVLAAFGVTVALGAAPIAGVVVAASLSSAALVLSRMAPLPLVIAAPRLLPAAFLAGGVARLLLGRAHSPSPFERSALALLVAGGTLLHGAVVFFPNHNPPDLDIHVRRALDLGDVPFEYGAMMRYGSQLPTAHQDRGPATDALGSGVLIPYSPLPNFFYYGAHRLGLDLYWAMTVLNAALAMLVVLPLWLAAARVWGREAAWISVLLYALDLAVWHHLGRSHAPAVFGAALGTMALAHLLRESPRLVEPRRIATAGLVLGVAVLGYSSLVVLIGFFGVALLVLLCLPIWDLSPAARRGLALALVLGGLVAGALFYFHYVPGMLHGASTVEASPDAFRGSTFFIFHNESRQTLRLWRLGLMIPFAAGLMAAPFALRRAPKWARPVLLSWLAAWVLIVVFKEPAFFPKLLRWGKEDQFLSPLLCLLVGGAVAAVPGRAARWTLAALALAVAAWLAGRDFSYHANSLLF